jgi:hypothetical protein
VIALREGQSRDEDRLTVWCEFRIFGIPAAHIVGAVPFFANGVNVLLMAFLTWGADSSGYYISIQWRRRLTPGIIAGQEHVILGARLDHTVSM